MTIKEFIRSALTEKGAPYQAFIEDKVSLEIKSMDGKIRASLDFHEFQLEELYQDFGLVASFKNVDIIEIEPLRSERYHKNYNDHTIELFFEYVLTKGENGPFIAFDQDGRIHKIKSKVEGGKLLLELIAYSKTGDSYPKGKLIPK